MMMATGAGMRSILSGIQKHMPDYKIGPRLGKVWQGVRNGLSCLGEFRQAFLAHDSSRRAALMQSECRLAEARNANQEESRACRAQDRQTPQKRGAKARGGPTGETAKVSAPVTSVAQ
jgi:hypothetical protein